MTENALNGRGLAGCGVARGRAGVSGDEARQCAGGSGLRHTCPRSPHSRTSRVLCKWLCFYGGQITASAGVGCDRGGGWRRRCVAICVVSFSHVLAREMFTAKDACASLVCLHRVKHRPNLEPTLTIHNYGPVSLAIAREMRRYAKSR